MFTLKNAIKDTLTEEINKSSNKILRIDIKSRWPIEDAIKLLNFKYEIVVGLLNNNRQKEFEKINYTNDYNYLTKLRNTPFKNRSNILILIGSANGIGQAGFKQVGSIIQQSDVCKTWLKNCLKYVESNYLGRELDIRKNLVKCLIELVSESKLTGQSVDEYFSTIFSEKYKETFHIHNKMWMLGMIPDENLLSSNNIESRLTFNESKVDELKLDYENSGPKYNKLLKSDDSLVKSFIRWLDTRSDADLEQTELNAILKALQIGDTGVTTTSKLDLFKFLKDKSNQDRASQLMQIQKMIDELNLDDLTEINEDFNEISLRVRGSSSINSEWNSFAGSLVQDGNEPTMSFPISVVTLTNNLQDKSSHPNSEIFYRNALSNSINSDLVDLFFKARKNLIDCLELFSCQNIDLLTLLIISPKSLENAINYIEIWKQLLKAFLELPKSEEKDNLGVILGIMDGHWFRNIEPNESLESPKIGKKNKFLKVEFLPTHPWRLEPITSLAKEICDRFDAEPNIVDTTLWALDRAVPSFKVLQIADSTLNFSTLLEGKLIFNAVASNALPPVTSYGGLLKRTFDTYVKIHPWSIAGSTISILNSPAGGFLKKLTDDLLPTFKHDPSIILIRDRNTEGTERDDDFPGIAVSQDVEDILLWLEQNKIARDLSFYFISGLSGQSTELGQGGYGTINIVLSNSGFDKNGKPISIPQIRLAPDDSNEIITLLRKVGGSDEIKASTYDLTLPENIQNLLPSLAKNTNWLIIAASSAISSFEVRDPFNVKMQQIAEFDEGIYRFFVFTKGTEPLAETVRERIKNLPIAPSRLNELENLINGLTKTLPQKVFDIALNSFGPEEALGLMTARALAQKEIPNEDLLLEISLDNVSWTQQWFEKSKKRADLILVAISSNPEEENPIRIMVIEAKASTREYVEPKINVEPFAEAVEQIENTRDLLNNLFNKGEKGLVEGLQQRTLIEQIATKAAAMYSKSDENNKEEKFKIYFKHISKLGDTKSLSIPNVAGMAVVTFLNGVQSTKIKLDSDLKLVSASSRLLEQVLKEEMIDEPEILNQSKVDNDLNSKIGQIVNDEKREMSKIKSGDQKRSSNEFDQTSVNKLVGELFNALKYRSEFLGNISDVETQIGPTFLTVNIPFAKGSSLSPLQRAESDIARDLGVATVNIENLKEEAGKIRVLIPRKDRQFPKLDFIKKDLELTNNYLNLEIGLDLNGEKYNSAISNWPHALVAGSTGSGKTTFIRSILKQLDILGPNHSNVIIVDGKGETDYFGILNDNMFNTKFPEPQLNIDSALNVLEWLKDEEIPNRKKLVLEYAKTNSARVDAKKLFIESINLDEKPLISPLIVVIDEFNELMIRGGSDKNRFTDAVTSLAQAARSVLVHLVLATQRPDRNVLPGVIKANLQARFAFRLLSPSDSVIVLNHGGAEKLLNHGDMLLQLNGQEDERLQGFWVD